MRFIAPSELWDFSNVKKNYEKLYRKHISVHKSKVALKNAFEILKSLSNSTDQKYVGNW